MNGIDFAFSHDWIISIDDDIIVINKPAGLLTIPDGYNPTLPCLSRLLGTEYPGTLVVHRLDKDTSGLVVIARNKESHRQLNIQFTERRVKKNYHAITHGIPEWINSKVNLPLLVNGDRRHRTVVDYEKGKPAVTEVNVIRHLSDRYSSMQAIPHTGYTHQIRAHLAAIGFPIIFDPLYSNNIPVYTANQTHPSRLALHAKWISFTHPAQNINVQFEAPDPPDFQHFILKHSG